MERNDDASVTFDEDEVLIVRAALWTVKHYMNQVWDRSEVFAVSGHTHDEFDALGRTLDKVRKQDAVRHHRQSMENELHRLASLTDAQLSQRQVRIRLSGIVRQASDADIVVPTRLSAFAAEATAESD